jgi:uncharacterized protein (UPF0303 family)
MTPDGNGIPTAAPSAFDPDYRGEQTEQSLKDLIEQVVQEMEEFQFDRFSRDDALSLGMLLAQLGAARSLPVAIDIRQGDHILFHCALQGATPDKDLWIRRKSMTATRFAVPSLLVGLRARLRGEAEDWLDQSDYAAYGGAFPLVVRGVGHVATVTVSGLPQKADHDLVVEAFRAFRRQRDDVAPWNYARQSA